MTEHGAEEHLRAIRQLMERATVYRAISAPAALVGGLLSVCASGAMLVLPGIADSRVFFALWTAVLLVTSAANAAFIWRGAHRRGEPLISPGMKVALRSVLPALFAGAAISAILAAVRAPALLSVLFWLLFYGLALLSTMNFAPQSIVALGWAFLLTSLAAFGSLIAPSVEIRHLPELIMGATFGLYHLVYAGCTWPRRCHALDQIERRPLVTHEPPLL